MCASQPWLGSYWLEVTDRSGRHCPYSDPNYSLGPRVLVSGTHTRAHVHTRFHGSNVGEALGRTKLYELFTAVCTVTQEGKPVRSPRAWTAVLFLKDLTKLSPLSTHAGMVIANDPISDADGAGRRAGEVPQ